MSAPGRYDPEVDPLLERMEGRPVGSGLLRWPRGRKARPVIYLFARDGHYVSLHFPKKDDAGALEHAERHGFPEVFRRIPGGGFSLVKP